MWVDGLWRLRDTQMQCDIRKRNTLQGAMLSKCRSQRTRTKEIKCEQTQCPAESEEIRKGPSIVLISPLQGKSARFDVFSLPKKEVSHNFASVLGPETLKLPPKQLILL